MPSPWRPKQGDLFLHLRPGNTFVVYEAVEMGHSGCVPTWRWFCQSCAGCDADRGVDLVLDVEGREGVNATYEPGWGEERVDGIYENAHCMGLVPMIVPVPDEWEAAYRLGGAKAFLALLAQGEGV